jgi:hypothetical protein
MELSKDERVQVIVFVYGSDQVLLLCDIHPVGVACTFHNTFMFTRVFNLRDVQVWAG